MVAFFTNFSIAFQCFQMIIVFFVFFCIWYLKSVFKRISLYCLDWRFFYEDIFNFETGSKMKMPHTHKYTHKILRKMYAVLRYPVRHQPHILSRLKLLECKRVICNVPAIGLPLVCECNRILNAGNSNFEPKSFRYFILLLRIKWI